MTIPMRHDWILLTLMWLNGAIIGAVAATVYLYMELRSGRRTIRKATEE